MSHPNSNATVDLAPIELGDILENTVTGERATVLALPWENSDGRAVAELLASPGARVVGEHRHPSLVERFEVLEGELTLKLDGVKRILGPGQGATIEAGTWHDWWNAGDSPARVRVEITPGHRFVHMIETLFGLAQLGHVGGDGMPNLLQLSLTAPEFADVIVFRTPPMLVQRLLFRSLAPIARWRGYRATYPQLSRSLITK
jgi:quercetin dioxygenase-like cupin family protein